MTDNPHVELAHTTLIGPHIDLAWYKHIQINNKPYFPALIILADVIYWSKPHIIINPETNQIERYQSKIKNKYLHRKSSEYEHLYGLTRKTIKKGMDLLIDLQLVSTKEVTTTTHKQTKVIWGKEIQPHIKNILKITTCTMKDETLIDETHPPVPKEQGRGKKVPYTKSTNKSKREEFPKGNGRLKNATESTLKSKQEKRRKLRDTSLEPSQKNSIEPSKEVKRMIKYWNKHDILVTCQKHRRGNKNNNINKYYTTVVSACELFLKGKLFKNGSAYNLDSKYIPDLDMDKIDYTYYGFQDYVDNLVNVLVDLSFKQPVKYGKKVSIQQFLMGSNPENMAPILLTHCILPPKTKQKSKNRQEDIEWIMSQYKERFNPEYNFKANDLKSFDTFLSWAFEYFSKWENGMPQLKKALGRKDDNSKFYNVIDTYALGAVREYWKQTTVTPGLFRSPILHEKVDKYIRWHGMYN